MQSSLRRARRVSCVIVGIFLTSYYFYTKNPVESLEESKRPYSFLPNVTTSEEEARNKLLVHYEELSKNVTRESRLPDIIGIGAEKCGSGALLNFLRQHPLIKVKTMEVHFFDGHYHKGKKYYRQKLAQAADFEMVMEKTPAYFNKPEVDIPRMIKEDVPGVKLIVILCDPVNRTFSDFVHEQKVGTIPKDMRFEVFVDQYLLHFKGVFQSMNDRSATRFIREKDQNFHLSHLISTGLYFYHMQHWFEHFDRSNLYIADGEKLLTNPGEVIDEIQEFLGLPRLIIPADFLKSAESSFYCVRVPLGSKNQDLDCLESYRKGRTRLGMIIPPERTMKKLREFYKPYNEKLFELLGYNFRWQ